MTPEQHPSAPVMSEEAWAEKQAPRLVEIARAVHDHGYQAGVQVGAQAAVDALAERGLLRQAPAETAIVKRVIRDERGTITAVVERTEQVESAP